MYYFVNTSFLLIAMSIATVLLYVLYQGIKDPKWYHKVSAALVLLALDAGGAWVGYVVAQEFHAWYLLSEFGYWAMLLGTVVPMSMAALAFLKR